MDIININLLMNAKLVILKKRNIINISQDLIQVILKTSNIKILI